MALVLPAMLALGAGCDPNAQATANDRPFASKDRMSKAYESCASTLDCSADLRCFANVCQPTKASLLGDYFAAAGAYALTQGDLVAALESYTAAVNRYQSDKVPMPLGLQCQRGRALAAVAAAGGARDETQAELAAKALHRCLREAPVGSHYRLEALAELARLTGLDPELLARDGDVDRYLTKEAPRPDTASLKVSITSDGRSRSRSYTGFVELLQSDELRAPLVACWEQHWNASKETALAVTMPVRHRFVEGEFEENDRDQLTIEGMDEGGPAAGSAERCVVDAVATAADGFTRGKRTGSRWTANLTIAIE